MEKIELTEIRDGLTLTGISLGRTVNLGNFSNVRLEAHFAVSKPMTVHQAVMCIYPKIEEECKRLKVKHSLSDESKPSKSKKNDSTQNTSPTEDIDTDKKPF